MRLGAANAALTLAVVLVLGVVTTHSARAQTFTVLHNFYGVPDGGTPYAGVIMDASGNLYGDTEEGGSSNYGTVFKLNKSHYETVLHSFTESPDGGAPFGGLVRDAAGNLYGTTGPRRLLFKLRNRLQGEHDWQGDRAAQLQGRDKRWGISRSRCAP